MNPADTELAPNLVLDTPEDEHQPYRPDPSRVFYHSNGHFHCDYQAVEVDRKNRKVLVKWAAGLVITLTGGDALQFLRLNRSRHAQLFAGRSERKAA